MSVEEMTDISIKSLDIMSDIIDIMLDRDTYYTKDKAYDAIEKVLVDNDVLGVVV